MDTSMVLDPTGLDPERAARVFSALADPARLRVLAVLADSQRCVCEIRTAAPMAANLLSYHLRTLRAVGLVESTRRGRFIDYRLAVGAADLIRAALSGAGFSADVEDPAGCAAACEAPER